MLTPFLGATGGRCQLINFPKIHHQILHGLVSPFFSVVCLRRLQNIAQFGSGQVNFLHDYPLQKTPYTKSGQASPSA
jgi:hypothetical protein